MRSEPKRQEPWDAGPWEITLRWAEYQLGEHGRWGNGEWTASANFNGSGMYDASGPDPLAAMQNLVLSVCNALSQETDDGE